MILKPVEFLEDSKNSLTSKTQCRKCSAKNARVNGLYQVIWSKEVLLLHVEKVEAEFEHFDLGPML